MWEPRSLSSPYIVKKNLWLKEFPNLGRSAMEILVDHSLGIPSDAILSVRCGGTRRQAPMETICNQPLKFPLQLGEVGEPLKIDLLQPLASARLVLHPKEDLYSISFEKNGMLLGMKILGPCIFDGTCWTTKVSSGMYGHVV